MKNSGIYLIQAFGFDVNGTLLNDTPVPFLTVINMMFRRLGLEPVPHEILRREFGQPWTKVFRVRGVNDAEWPDSKLYDLYNHLYQSFGTPPLAPHVIPVLKTLKRRGFKLFVVTTQLMSVTIPALQNVLQFFDGAFYGVGNKSKTLEALSENHGRVVYVGDQVADIEAAKAAGSVSAAYTGGLHPEEMLRGAGPDFTISSFVEILNLPILPGTVKF